MTAGFSARKLLPATAAIVLMTAALLPLALVDVPPLVDYLNHIARDFVLAHFDESLFFPQFYRPDWSFLPNLAMDAVVVPLAKVLPIDLAGKLFLAATLFLTAASVFALSKALHGRVEIPAFLVFFFVYHRLILWGNLNFAFGVTLALLAFALWLRLRERAWWFRLGVFAAFATVILLCHLFALAVYLLCVGGYEMGRSVETWRRGTPSSRTSLGQWPLLVAHAAVPVLLFLALSPTTGRSGEIRFGTLPGKLTPVFHVVNNYDRMLDYATFFVLIGAIGLGLLRRWLELSRPLWWPLALGSMIQLVIPTTLFGSYSADARLPIVLWMLLAAGLKPTRAVNPRVLKPVLLGFFLLALARFGVVGFEWQRTNGVYREYFAALDRIEPGSKLLSVVPLPRHPSFHHPPLNFIASRAVIQRQAFDPFLFADRGHQPLNFAEPFVELVDRTPGPVVYYPESASTTGIKLEDWENPFKPEVIRQYDYVLLVSPRLFPGMIPGTLEPVGGGNDFVLYRIPPLVVRPE